MVDLLDISVEGIFLMVVLCTLVLIIIGLFNVNQGVNSHDRITLSSPVIYLFLFVTILFALIKFYQYSGKFKEKTIKKEEGKSKWLKGF